MFFTAIIFILILGILVFVHELGHFYVARKFGVKAEEFGFGFPPRICGWKKVGGRRKLFFGNEEAEKINSEDTIYSLNWIPLGGFVKIKGEDGILSGENVEPDSFAGKKIWQRAAILSAGVTMNVVLCVVALSIAFMLGAPQVIDESAAGAVVKDEKVQIIFVIKDSPAEKAGVKIGDVIKNLDGQSFGQISEIQDYVAGKEGQDVAINLRRLDQDLNLKIKPVVLSETKKPSLGVGLSKTGIVAYPWYESIWLGVRGTYLMAGQIVAAFAMVIKNAIIGRPLGVDVAGPVGIAVMTGEVARLGFVYILQFMALLSLNLAIINFLPFPALDGGRVLFLIIEKIRGRAVNQKVERIIHTVGFALLIFLIIIVTGRDVLKFKDNFINLWQRLI